MIALLWYRMAIGRAKRNNTTERPEGFHGNAAASVFAALHRSDDLRRRHGVAARHRDRGSQGARSGFDTDLHFRRPDHSRRSRPAAAKPRDLTQLSDRGAYALPAG